MRLTFFIGSWDIVFVQRETTFFAIDNSQVLDDSHFLKYTYQLNKCWCNETLISRRKKNIKKLIIPMNMKKMMFNNSCYAVNFKKKCNKINFLKKWCLIIVVLNTSIVSANPFITTHWHYMYRYTCTLNFLIDCYVKESECWKCSS